MTYADFLASKRAIIQPCGPTVESDQISSALFPFQRDLVLWALRKGRAALFADTGLGKTLMQLEWSRLIWEMCGRRVLILAPLAVARQTVAEGARFGIQVTYARSQVDAEGAHIVITNYEMLHAFDVSVFGAVVLDESSILKNFEGKVRTQLIRAFRSTPYRLACTATPAPNDVSELANHAEFLNICKREEMLATFFVHDDDGWRLKGHAREPFYRWLASWAMSLKRPSDLGYDNAGYDLPPLDIRRVLVDADYVPSGQLFATALRGITERAQVRRETLEARVQAAADLIMSEPDEPWVAWVGLNDEGTKLAARVSGAVLVEGVQSPDEKAARLEAFAAGDVRVLVTKTGIAGQGLNWQHCARMAFVGLSDSYEAYYQAIRRLWRFGQRRPVHAYVVLSETEEAIYANVKRKQIEAEATSAEFVRYVAEFERQEIGAANGRTETPHGQPFKLPVWLTSALR